MLSPAARGALSEDVLAALRSEATSRLANAPEPDNTEDAHLALWVLYELHHRGFDDVADDLEWDPNLISVRRQLEADFEHSLRARTPDLPEPGAFAETFFDFVADHEGPSLSAHLHRAASAEQGNGRRNALPYPVDPVEWA